jgi:hypothetical protein
MIPGKGKSKLEDDLDAIPAPLSEFIGARKKPAVKLKQKGRQAERVNSLAKPQSQRGR